MYTKLSSALIPARFLLTTGNFMATILALQHSSLNAYASVTNAGSLDEYEAAKSTVTHASVTAFICMILCYLGLFGGWSMFFNRVNLTHIILHGISGIFTALYILDTWHVNSLWYIVGFTTVITGILELGLIIAVFGLKVIVY